MRFRIRGYEPRGRGFESLRARQIEGINNDTNSVLSQVTDKTQNYQDIVVQLVNETPGGLCVSGLLFVVGLVRLMPQLAYEN